MVTPLNIFLDTCVLHEDYFFQNKSNKQLFQYMKDGLINIFMSDIVLKEMRRHYQIELEQSKTAIAKIKSDAKRLKFEVDIKDKLDDVSMLKRFDDSYRGLDSKYQNFSILNFSNEMLTDVIEKAIYKKPPFFNNEKKDQLKDCIIWLTYSKYAENAGLYNCFLLTDNITDFCDKEDISKIHSELQNESQKFIVYRSANDFITKMSGEIEQPLKEFREYIEGLNIDSEYIRQQLEDNFSTQLEQELAIELASDEQYELLIKIDDVIGGDVNMHYFNIESIEEYSVQILNQRALIFGRALVSAEIDLSKYNFDPDCPTELSIEVVFNYDLLEDEVCTNLEIPKFEY